MLRVTNAQTANPAPARTAKGMEISCRQSETPTMSAMTGTERVRTPSSRLLLPRVSTLWKGTKVFEAQYSNQPTLNCSSKCSAVWLDLLLVCGSEDQETLGISFVRFVLTEGGIDPRRAVELALAPIRDLVVVFL